jgi:hypothetical protein
VCTVWNSVHCKYGRIVFQNENVHFTSSWRCSSVNFSFLLIFSLFCIYRFVHYRKNKCSSWKFVLWLLCRFFIVWTWFETWFFSVWCMVDRFILGISSVNCVPPHNSLQCSRPLLTRSTLSILIIFPVYFNWVVRVILTICAIKSWMQVFIVTSVLLTVLLFFVQDLFLKI